ncbi:MAG: hypothetical protein WB522_19065, partial [Pseudolabrys sp.]
IPFDHPERGLGGTGGERDGGNKADGGAKDEAPTHFRSSYHMKNKIKHIRLRLFDIDPRQAERRSMSVLSQKRTLIGSSRMSANGERGRQLAE